MSHSTSTNQKYAWINSQHKGVSYIQQFLKQDAPLFVYFTNPKLAETVYKQCLQNGNLEGKNILLAFAKTINTEAVQKIKDNHTNFNDYSVVFCSQDLGINLSISGDYFQNVIVFYSRCQPIEGLPLNSQIPFKNSNINTIICVKVDHLNHGVSSKVEIETIKNHANAQIEVRDFLKTQVQAGNTQAKRLYHDLLESHILRQAEIDLKEITDHQLYYENIEAELINEGRVEIFLPDDLSDQDIHSTIISNQ